MKTTPSQPNREELIEKLASIEHERWSKWQKYLHSVCIIELEDLNFNETGRLIIESDRVRHWERQIATLYSNLSEKEKQSDRNEVLAYMPFLDEYIAQAVTEADEAGYRRGILENSIKLDQKMLADMKEHATKGVGFFHDLFEAEKQKARAEERKRIVRMIEEKRGKLTRIKENSPAFSITNDIIASITDQKI